MRALGYVRTSTEEQGRSHLGIEAQTQTVVDDVARRGWDLVDVIEDNGSAGNLSRDGIMRALGMLRDGTVDVLVVAKLDRLSRSVIDFAGIMERARDEGWSLVALDLGVDMTTPSGELVAHVIAAMAQFERRQIQQRTKDALAALKRRGHRLGRPVETPQDVRTMIVEMRRRRRMTYDAIATELNRKEIPRARNGSEWTRAAVWKIVRSVELDEEIAA